jgi:preprotein translocase subunit SecA
MYYSKKKFDYEAFKEIYGNALCNDKFPYMEEKSFTNCKDKNAITSELASYVMEYMSKQKEVVGEEHYKSLLKQLLLDAIDFFWRRHLNNIEQLKKGIYLMSYGQKDPKVEFKCSAYELYDDMLDDIRLNYLRKSFSMHMMLRNNAVTINKA